MNKKGFTLTELIAVIVIIGLILLTAVPAVYKLLINNEKTKYDYYYKMVQEAAYAYAKVKTDEIGNSLNSGCTVKVVSDLIDDGFLKKYDIDNETVTDSQIIINNEYGKISVNVYIKIGKYEGGKKKNDVDQTCISYIPNTVNTLSVVLKNKFNNNNYIVDTTNNYVWYSGKLWRIVLTNDDGNIKLVTDDIISTIPFNLSSTNNSFDNSYIQRWLNEYYLNSLYNPNKYLVTYKWVNNNKKVGLLSKDDLVNLSFDDTTWTLTPSGSDKIYIGKNDSNTQNYDVAYGVRASVFIKGNIKVVNGDGEKTSPYQLEGNSISNQKDKTLRTRYSGEYVQDKNGNKYRIVSINGEYVKLISESTINDVALSNANYTLSISFIDTLNNTAIGDFSSLLTSSVWYLGDNSNSINYVFGNINTDISSLKIGLPMYAELFASNTLSSCLWTLTRDSTLTNKVVTLKNNTTYLTEVNGMNTCKVKYMVYIDGNTKIIRGSGIFDNPFVIIE